MRVVHLMRKCDPAEWGGTETAVQRLLHGLKQKQVESVVYSPELTNGLAKNGDSLAANGWPVKRFKTCVPVWGISEEKKKQFVAVGGNLMSFDLFPALLREKPVSLIHAHTQGRLATIALRAARRRKIPFVTTIHGGLFDLPEALKKNLNESDHGGLEWGKVFGWLLKTRRFYDEVDAVVTCNPKEAALFREKYPDKRVMVQPHGVPVEMYREPHGADLFAAFPQLKDKSFLLCVGRIDSVKNQSWLIERFPEILKKHPRTMLVLAGASTDETYFNNLKRRIQELGLNEHVLLTGGLPQGDPRLIGLFQKASAILLPSVSETFGLVILESWASGTVPISSRTSGGSALIRDGENGWLFDFDDPKAFHDAVEVALDNREFAARLAAAGHDRVVKEFDTVVLAGRMKNLYEELIAARAERGCVPSTSRSTPFAKPIS
jgi:starch synthase